LRVDIEAGVEGGNRSKACVFPFAMAKGKIRKRVRFSSELPLSHYLYRYWARRNYILISKIVLDLLLFGKRWNTGNGQDTRSLSLL
jgi:hypothetical protein